MCSIKVQVSSNLIPTKSPHAHKGTHWATTLPSPFCQVLSGYLQLVCNLGNGEHTLVVESCKVNDVELHTVVVTRTEGSLELLLDDQFFNRTSLQGSGEDVLLSISRRHVFLGGGVEAESGTVVLGFKGCITGATLDRRELPFDANGNIHFDVERFPSGSAVDMCPLGVLEDKSSDVPDEYVFGGLGAIVALLVVVSFVFVVTCAGYNSRKRSRRGQHNVRRTTSSPSQEGFTWHARGISDDRKSPTSESFKLTVLGSGVGVAKQRDEVDNGGVAETGMAIQNPVSSRQSGVRTPPPANSRQESAQQGAQGAKGNRQGSAQNRQGSAQSRQGSGQGSGQGAGQSRQGSTRKSGRVLTVPPPSEGFSAVSQPNPGFLQESPDSSTHDLLQEEGKNRFVRHMQSLGRQLSVRSSGTDRSDTNTVYIPAEVLRMDDAEVTKFIHKKVEVADDENENFDLDKMEHFTEEGEFEPLGSIGSLYDFVLELDTSRGTSPTAQAMMSSHGGGRATSPATGQAQGPVAAGMDHGSHSQPVSSIRPSSPKRRSGRGKRPKPIMIRSPPTTAAPPPLHPQQPHPPSRDLGSSPVRVPVATSSPSPPPPGYETKSRERSTEPLLLSPSPSPPHKAKAPPQNGHWVLMNKHSASQPETFDLDLQDNGDTRKGSGQRGPAKLRRSGRRSHRVAGAATNQNKDAKSILEKFHHVTANPNHFANSRAREESNIL